VISHAGGNLRTPSGKYLMRFRVGRDTPLLANHRAELQEVLRQSLPAECLRTGAEVVGVEDTGRQVTVAYRTSTGQRLEETAEVVVGADGIQSTVRRLLWPQHPAPVFQRVICWRGVTGPGKAPSVTGFQTWGRGERSDAHPLPNQRVFWFHTSRQVRPGIDYLDGMAEVRRRVRGWHDPIPDLLDGIPPERLLCHDIFDLDLMPYYVRGRVAFLGDAAHAMTPFLAQGACQAVEDATVLVA
jgi:2-polyprenyl-6-methoxyphenol hydroxylase-like FAD-dependent oxidoreductase